MSTINPQYHNPQLTVKKEDHNPKKSNTNQQTPTNTTKQQQTDTYDKSSVPTGGLYDGLEWCGEISRNTSFTRTDRKDTVTLEETNLNASFKTDGLDAKFSAALKKEAFTFSGLEKKMHDLLGFTLEAYKTSFDASGQITASGALEDGTFFDSSFSAFASAASITYLYTSNGKIASQYDKDPQSTIEINFSSLKSLMESVVVQKNTDGKASYFFNSQQSNSRSSFI